MQTRQFLKRYFVVIIFLCIVGVRYVSQQNAIIIVSYEVKRNELALKQLLDRNKALAYNIAISKSPASINESLNRHGIELYPIKGTQLETHTTHADRRHKYIWLGASFIDMAKKILGFLWWRK